MQPLAWARRGLSASHGSSCGAVQRSRQRLALPCVVVPEPLSLGSSTASSAPRPAKRSLASTSASELRLTPTLSAQSVTSVDPRIKQWGMLQPEGVSLQDLRDIGIDRRKRRAHGTFLHRELKIRFSQRVLELQSLPDGLPQRAGIQDVIDWYSGFAYDLDSAPVPETARQDEEFTSLLQRVFTEHTEIIQALAIGVQGLMDELGPTYAAIQPQVDAVLRRFFMARIGMRFLIQHHIESFEGREGFSGILQLECSAAEIARKAAKDSAQLCRARLGQAPPIVVNEVALGNTFTYVPMHLQYMLTEVFKNACRATVERHGHGFDDELPVVNCLIAYGKEDVSIKISDEGGGISRKRMQDVWKFMYSTVKRSPWKALIRKPGSRPASGDSASNPLQRQRASSGGVLAGYGVGLTLTRLYAQYFGGDMRILSMDGFGTDVYLHLSRLGQNCENLPRVVLNSPSMHDSSLLGEDEQPELLLISHDEAALLRQELAALRKNDVGS